MGGIKVNADLQRISCVCQHQCTAANPEEGIIWHLKQASYAVTIQADQRSIMTDPNDRMIATPASLDELRTLAEPRYELVCLGYRKVTAA